LKENQVPYPVLSSRSEMQISFVLQKTELSRLSLGRIKENISIYILLPPLFLFIIFFESLKLNILSSVSRGVSSIGPPSSSPW